MQTSFESLAHTHLEAAKVIARQEDGFDYTGADMVLRNAAVLSDRLEPKVLSHLSEGTLHKIDALTFMADDIAPPSEDDLERYPDEGEVEYEYRTRVWAPIHRLQTKVHTRAFDKDDPNEVSRIRFAVETAGNMFSSLLLETTNEPVVIETERYFWGNALAAAKRAKTIAAS